MEYEGFFPIKGVVWVNYPDRNSVDAGCGDKRVGWLSVECPLAFRGWWWGCCGSDHTAERYENMLQVLEHTTFTVSKHLAAKIITLGNSFAEKRKLLK